MLKNIPSIISPELMKVLLEMGHGDEIVFADGNYPSSTSGPSVIRSDGNDIPELLKAVLLFFPLDVSSDSNVILMKPGHQMIPPIWASYKEILEKSGEKPLISTLERIQFYQRASKSYGIVATSEKALFANIILKKGVIA